VSIVLGRGLLEIRSEVQQLAALHLLNNFELASQLEFNVTPPTHPILLGLGAPDKLAYMPSTQHFNSTKQF